MRMLPDDINRATYADNTGAVFCVLSDIDDDYPGDFHDFDNLRTVYVQLRRELQIHRKPGVRIRTSG
jgi:hypothetical protein